MLPTSSLGVATGQLQARRQGLPCRQSMLLASRGRALAAGAAVRQTANAVVATAPAAPRVLRVDADPPPEPKRGPSSTDPSQPDLGPHGPKLLPRPRRPQLDPMGGPGGPPGGGGPGSGGTQRVIGNLVAYTGIVGTTAIVLAGFAGIDVWESFRWTNTSDLALAAALSVPLQAANAALLLPTYSALKLPQLADLKTMEANLKYDKEQREAAARAAEAAEAPAAAGAESVAAAAATPEAGAAVAATAAAAAAPEGTVASTSAATAAPAASAPADAATGAPSTSTSTAPQASATVPPTPLPLPLPPGGLVPASNWGAGGGGPGGSGPDVDRAVVLGVDVTGLRDALHLAQGHIISNNPTARINAGLEAAFAAVDTAAGEMLYRGVALTWLAAWLEDRIYEAGAEEAFTQQLPAALGTVLGPAAAGAAERLGVYGDAEVAVAAALVGYTVWNVLARNRREVARLEALMDAVGRGISKASAKNALNGDSAKRGSGSGVATTVVMGPGAIPIAASTAGGPLNGAGAGAGTGGPPGKQAALQVMTRGAAVRAARDALQVATINAVFIATGGNLAASYGAALANQLLISAWQRLGARRMRERSSALAKELKAYNAEMQRILAKYTHKLPPVARAQFAAMDAAASGSSSSSSTSSSKDQAQASAAETAPAASMASVATESLASRATAGESSSSSTSSTSGCSSTSSSSSSGGDAGAQTPGDVAGGDAGKLQSALSALSFLVPEPEPPARGKAGAKAAMAPAPAATSGDATGAHEKS